MWIRYGEQDYFDEQVDFQAWDSMLIILVGEAK